MIIMKLAGGLGNQFFQYACGLALAQKHNSQLVLDVSWYRKNLLKAQVKKWQQLAAGLWRGSLASAVQDLKRNARPLAIFDFPITARRLTPQDQVEIEITEADPYRVDPRILNGPDHASYQGYFNSEKYFLDISPLIRQQLTPDPSCLSQAGQNFLQAISRRPAISLHVRRGDYLQPSAQNYHGLLERRYYEQALKIIRQKNPVAPLFVFSDDPDWCRQQLDLNQPAIFVSGLTPKEDLLLMSRCRYQIIANSTFSWWAAWLNADSHKEVIAPGQWLKNSRLEGSDLFPNNWLII